jgi:4'-phosphopantetheinyl transferase
MGMASKTPVEISEVRDVTDIDGPGELREAVVHLWERHLDATSTELSACHELLSTEEKERAQRFRVDRPRNVFVLTRGTLRRVLAHYLKREPEGIRFGYEAQGKPFLVGAGSLSFNVSHTDGLALIGIVRGRRIGVDVEKVNGDTEVRKLAERFFSGRERRDLTRLRGNALREAFFRVWTRKEAYIKATGEGLGLPLDQFDVSISAGDRDALRATRPDTLEAERWTISDVAIRSGYAAAVAVAVSGQIE